MSNYITIRVELDDGTVTEKRAEITGIDNRAFLAYQTLAAAEVVTERLVNMLIVNEGTQARPTGVSS
ncbi:hypothetical protein G9444_2444 [Rhodococcus erythropolis]|uniref:Uncharacterized protein n=1 Tax=Rhodococcus erythropolis TaxID=1833 RepID=A0A6G9CS22_RHOER|nr:hypothetical protein [Rhodococcus erythropolis]QIP39688.1 hypothetical protein G9444_2444 [Rhodococcus erythropolis]